MEKVTNDGPTSVTGTSNTTDGFLNKAASSAHAAVDSVAGAADQAARKAQPAIGRVATMAHNEVDKVAGAAAPTVDWFSKQGNALKATQKKLATDACSYVAANPLKSMGMAVVAGFILSRLIHSRG